MTAGTIEPYTPGIMERITLTQSGTRRLLLLGDARQVHITRWSDHFSRNGYSVLTISLQHNPAFSGRIAYPQVPSVLPDFIRYPAAVRAVRRMVEDFRPDIINAHFLPNYGMMAALLGHRPWILSTWGSDIMLLPEKSLFHRWRTTFVLRRASFITSDAKVMSNKLIELGCDAGRILTVPYGVDENRFNSSGRKTGAPGPALLSNRKLEPVYNIETIIDAFSPCKQRLPDSRLTIVGSGSLLPALQDRARASSAAESIRFQPAVPHAQVAELLRSHDIYLSLSFSDTTSVSLLEAMACGAFPIVSDIPANREWIKDGENGFLVPADDPAALAAAIERAWNDRALMRGAAERNRHIVSERANWDENMERVGHLFAKAMQQDA